MAPPRRSNRRDQAAGSSNQQHREEAMNRTMEVIERMMDRLEWLEDQRESWLNGHQAVDAPHRDDRLRFIAFKRADPPMFQGSSDPMVAISWLQEVERVFTVVPCSDDQKVTYGTYMLKEDAELWWEKVKRAKATRNELVTWEVFQEMFYKKYVPESACNIKDMEFSKLEQGNMLVDDYMAKFDELIRFSRVYQRVPNESWKCVRFENGLRPEILRVVAPMKIRDFDVLVDKCRIAESIQKGFSSKASRSDATRDAPQRSSGHRPPHHKQRFGSYQHSKGKAKTRAVPSLPVRYARYDRANRVCQKCSKMHGDAPCLQGKGVCYGCGKPGHIRPDCPEKKFAAPNAHARPVQQQQQFGRVVPANAQEAAQSVFIQGEYLVNGKPLVVLFDSGASYSFISLSCVLRLGLPVSELPTSDP